MASSISGITYDPDKTIANEKAHNPPYAMRMGFVNYATDKFGNKIEVTDKAPKLKVRSYYTVNVPSTDTDYYMRPLTIEDLVQLLSTRRARTVEAEINPMSVVIKERNQRLNDLGTLLGNISGSLSKQEYLKSEKAKNTEVACPGLDWYLMQYFTQQELEAATLPHEDHPNLWHWCITNPPSGPTTNQCITSATDGILNVANSLVKAKMDFLNNEAQSDMSRMENLVSKRDESFSMATDLTRKISDGRTSIINNIGG